MITDTIQGTKYRKIISLIAFSVVLFVYPVACTQSDYLSVSENDISELLTSSVTELKDVYDGLSNSYGNDLVYNHMLLAKKPDSATIHNSMILLPQSAAEMTIMASIDNLLWRESGGKFMSMSSVSSTQRNVWKISRYFEVCQDYPEYIRRVIKFCSLKKSQIDEHSDDLVRVAIAHPKEFITEFNELDSSAQLVVLEMLALAPNDLTSVFEGKLSRIDTSDSNKFLKVFRVFTKE